MSEHTIHDELTHTADPLPPTARTSMVTLPSSNSCEPIVARSERILSGDIRPDDYLKPPPEVVAWVEQYIAQSGTTIPPKTRQWMIDNNVLCHSHAGHEVICWRTGEGVIVLAHGAEVDPVLNALTPEQRSKITTEYP